jgi:hypothetical protein
MGEKLAKFSRPPVNELPLLDVPVEHVFHALSIDNVLILLNALLQEKQVLMHSTHMSLLGTIAECLCSFIFPLRWMHVYIPILPKKCIDFIHAPVPFLMGVHSSSVQGEQIPRDVIVVDLDNNVVAVNTKLHTLPEHNTSKLKQSLQKALVNFKRKPLGNVDMAFTLVPPPEEIDGKWSQQQQYEFPVEQIRTAFFRFFVALLLKYRNYMIKPSPDANVATDPDFDKYFRRAQFIKEQSEGSKFWMNTFIRTQAFNRFLMDRLLNENMNEITFFDESIQAKLNRSKFTFHKKDTPFQ